MRHLLTGLLVAAVVAVVTASALAGNQEIATDIAKNLRDNAELKDFKIGVKYQDGVACLRGRVASEEQMNCALKMVFQTAGVRRVINGLTIGSETQSDPSQTIEPTTTPPATSPAGNIPPPMQPGPTQRLEAAIAAEQQPVPQASAGPAAARIPGHAQRVANSYSQDDSQTLATAHQQAVPREALAPRRAMMAKNAGRPIPVAYTQPAAAMQGAQPIGGPVPAYVSGTGGGISPARYDQPHLPNYAWPSYAAYPNYAALTYPKQYSPTAWPYIGPFYPYPQVPMGWRKVTLEWDDGWWMLDFKD